MRKIAAFFLLFLSVASSVLSYEPVFTESGKPRILILCTGNSCRSQMAEGWGDRLWGDRYDFFSAGVEKKGLNPKAVAVMKEVGIDIGSHTSKLISELPGMDFDLVITVCDNAREHCPVFPANVKLVHHEFDDPPKMEAQCRTEQEKLANYRRVRDEIKALMEKIPELLEPSPTSGKPQMGSPNSR